MARLSDELLGQSASLEPLLEARAKDRMPSTLLFAGPMGIGKHLAALALTQALVCEKRGRLACGQCGPCIRVEKRQSESLYEVEPEGAGIKIEQAREVLRFISLRMTGNARVVIIDQAHLLNPQAANALLKSLEEPPSGTFFILITMNPAAVLPTIRSRSQLVRFKPLNTKDLKTVLGRIELEADSWLIESAHGSVANARRLAESREELRDLEEVTGQYLQRSLRQFPGEEVAKLRELLKDKTGQSYFFGLVQGVVKDALRMRAGLKPAQRAPWRDIASELAANSASSLGDLAESSLRMENDVSRNVDRGLVLETFALAWRKTNGG